TLQRAPSDNAAHPAAYLPSAPASTPRWSSPTVPDAAPIAADSLQSPEQARAAIEQFRADVARVKEQIQRAIVGHQDIIDGVLTSLSPGRPPLLEGLPALAKPLLTRSLAGALTLSFSRVQFTPDLMPADISGTTIVAETSAPDGSRLRQFVFQPGPIFAQIVL